MRKFFVIFFSSVALLLCGSAFAAQTGVSPELQKTILNVFPQSKKCGKSTNLRVISYSPTPDAKIESGVLVAGEIVEIWRASTCDTHTEVRYLFRLGPGKNDELQVIRFERLVDP